MANTENNTRAYWVRSEEEVIEEMALRSYCTSCLSDGFWHTASDADKSNHRARASMLFQIAKSHFRGPAFQVLEWRGANKQAATEDEAHALARSHAETVDGPVEVSVVVAKYRRKFTVEMQK